MYQPKEEPQSEEDWSAADEIYSSYFGVGNMKVFNEKMISTLELVKPSSQLFVIQMYMAHMINLTLINVTLYQLLFAKLLMLRIL